MTSTLCECCRLGFHAPFDRFEQVAASDAGPLLLWRCRRCGTLWQEDPRTARRMDDGATGPEDPPLTPRKGSP